MKAIKIIFVLFLTITIFCLIFIRIVPDYSNKYGFIIVSINDYKKYKQGYCLKEDRILSKDELYKRAILDVCNKILYMDKKIQFKYCIKTDRRIRECEQENINNTIGFYKIKDFKIDSITNEIEKSFNDYDDGDKWYSSQKFFLDVF